MLLLNVTRTGFLAGICLIGLSGCSWLSDWPPEQSEQARRTNAPPPPISSSSPSSSPAVKVMRTADATWLAPSSDIQAVDVNPAQGTQADKRFAARLNDLEREVERIRNDIGLMMPALTKLATVQGDIETILKRMGANDQVENANIEPAAGQPDRARSESAVRSSVPVKAQDPVRVSAPPAFVDNSVPASAVESAAAQPQPSAAMIEALRLGEHPGKTRLVFDVSDKVSFSYNIDNDNQFLHMDMDHAGWDGLQEMQVENSPVIDAYSTSPDGQGGTQMHFHLKQPVRVLWAQYLPPSGESGPRIVVDVAPL